VSEIKAYTSWHAIPWARRRVANWLQRQETCQYHARG
jgi:hypothetical protein